MRTRSQRFKALTYQEQLIVTAIPFITDVDYTPESKETYEKLPEPFRTEALTELEFRNNSFDELAKNKERQYA